MVLTRTDENELLTALHSGLFQELPWRLFLTRLRARTDADICRLYIRPAGEVGWRQVDTVQGRSIKDDSLRGDPSSLEELRGGRVYSGEELGEKPPGYARHIRVAWPEGGDLALSLLRLKGDFRAQDASLLASLASHLTIALRARMELEAARRRADVAGQALGSFSVGWLLVDGRARVLDCDSGATRMLEVGKMAIRASDGRLRFLFPEAEALFEEVLAQRDGVIAPSGAWLSDDPPIQLLITQPPEMASQSLARPHCLILMRQMVVNMPADSRFLPALFRLTRSEAALAAQIAGGASLTEAAEALALTIETARNYSKRIFVKTGARGQADLVRIVLEGVRLPRSPLD